MPEPDALTGRFAALRADLPTHPPGLAAAERVVRGRRRRRVMLTASLAVVLASVLGGAALGVRGAPPPAGTDVLDVGAPVGAIDAGTPDPSATPGGCSRYGMVRLDGATANAVTVRDDPSYPLCPAERVRVFVATYSLDAAGTQTLFRYQVGYLDADHDPLTLGCQVPGCHAAIYVGSGEQQIRESIVANVAPQGDMVWMKEENTCPADRSHS